MEIESGQEPAEVYASILATCAGTRFEIDGKIVYRAGEDRGPSLTLLEDDFIEIQSVKPWPGLDERINTIHTVLSQAADMGYKRDEISFSDPAAVMRDTETRSISRQLEGVQNHIQAGRVIVNLLRSARETLTLDAIIRPQAFMSHFEALPGDVWTITHSEYGLAAKNFIVQSIRRNFDGSASVSLKEDVPGTYADTLILPELQERIIEFGGEGRDRGARDARPRREPRSWKPGLASFITSSCTRPRTHSGRTAIGPMTISACSG